MTEYDDRYAGRVSETENGDTVQGSQIRQLYQALGPNPTDGHTDVGDRIATLEAALAGTANAAHTHDAAAITTGVINVNRLGANPGADLFLRGDGNWAYPSSEAQGLVVLNEGEAVPEAIPVGWIILRRAEA